MTGAGFEYAPVHEPLPAQAVSGNYQSKEWVEQNGFGYSTLFLESAQKNESIQDADPNTSYVDGLSVQAREEYMSALYGDSPLDDFPRDPETGRPLDPETLEPVDMAAFMAEVPPSGCEAVAETALPLDPDEKRRLELDSILDADPLVVEAQRLWVGCMRDSGYEHQNLQEILIDLRHRMAPIESAVYDSNVSTSVENEDGSPVTPARRGAAEIPRSVLEHLAQIQEWEINVASAAFRCAAPVELAKSEAMRKLNEP